MGMSASQYNLGFLTRRNHDISRSLMQLSSQKMSLTREMREVSADYQEALNSKTLKWSNNSGVTYSDLSYSNLMYPSDMNQNTPYLLTDKEGRVVVDSKYQKYAEMISPDGSAKGNYTSNRTAILSEITGIDSSKIESMDTYSAAAIEAKERLDGLKEPSRKNFTKNTSASDLLEKMTTTANFKKSNNWSQAYKKADVIDLGINATALNNVKIVFNNLKNTIAPYLMENAEAFRTACDTKMQDCIGLINSGTDLSNSVGMIQGKNNDYNLDVVQVIDQILSAAGVRSGSTSGYNSNTPTYTWYDLDNSAAYNKYQEEYKAWEAERASAEADYNNAVSSDNELLTADEEAKIAFYDAIFSSIAEKGWVQNYQINDTEYLNQMLQNNLYTITTVDRSSEYDTETNEFTWENEYSTDIASNFTNVFSVNDSDARNQALAEYENKKAIISEKESRIDTRMQDLQTEQAAIKQMIESIEKVRNDNIERTFSIMG